MDTRPAGSTAQVVLGCINDDPNVRKDTVKIVADDVSVSNLPVVRDVLRDIAVQNPVDAFVRVRNVRVRNVEKQKLQEEKRKLKLLFL
jgi:hypothetical protein